MHNLKTYQSIKQDLADGLPYADIQGKYHVSSGTIGKIKGMTDQEIIEWFEKAKNKKIPQPKAEPASPDIRDLKEQLERKRLEKALSEFGDKDIAAFREIRKTMAMNYFLPNNNNGNNKQYLELKEQISELKNELKRKDDAMQYERVMNEIKMMQNNNNNGNNGHNSDELTKILLLNLVNQQNPKNESRALSDTTKAMRNIYEMMPRQEQDKLGDILANIEVLDRWRGKGSSGGGDSKGEILRDIIGQGLDTIKPYAAAWMQQQQSQITPQQINQQQQRVNEITKNETIKINPTNPNSSPKIMPSNHNSDGDAGIKEKGDPPVSMSSTPSNNSEKPIDMGNGLAYESLINIDFPEDNQKYNKPRWNSEKKLRASDPPPKELQEKRVREKQEFMDKMAKQSEKEMQDLIKNQQQEQEFLKTAGVDPSMVNLSVHRDDNSK